MSAKQKVSVYIDNAQDVPEIFLISEEHVRDVAGRHKEVAKRIDYRIGQGEDEFRKHIGEAEILVGWNFPREHVATLAPKLRWINLIGAGVDHLLPLDWLPSQVKMTNSSGAHRPKIDEFMMLTILMLNNRILELMTNQARQHWDYTYSSVVTGKTALVIGLGAAGSAAVDSCKKLGMRVIGVRRSGEPHPEADETHKPEDLLKLLPKADFVVVTPPKTPDTVDLLGRKELEAMKRGAGIVSIGRLGVIDDNAMIDLLSTGHLSGAIIDLEDPEFVPFDPRLWTTPNLLIVPHSLNNDPDRYAIHSVEIFFDNLERYLNKQPMKNLVDPVLGY